MQPYGFGNGISNALRLVARQGRGGDDSLALVHVDKDEIVIDPETRRQNPRLMAQLDEAFRRSGLDPAKRRVGPKANKHPGTELMEFRGEGGGDDPGGDEPAGGTSDGTSSGSSSGDGGGGTDQPDREAATDYHDFDGIFGSGVSDIGRPDREADYGYGFGFGVTPAAEAAFNDFGFGFEAPDREAAFNDFGFGFEAADREAAFNDFGFGFEAPDREAATDYGIFGSKVHTGTMDDPERGAGKFGGQTGAINQTPEVSQQDFSDTSLQGTFNAGMGLGAGVAASTAMAGLHGLVSLAGGEGVVNMGEAEGNAQNSGSIQGLTGQGASIQGLTVDRPPDDLGIGADLSAEGFNANFLATPEGRAIIAAGAGDPNGILIPDSLLRGGTSISSPQDAIDAMSQDQINNIFLQDSYYTGLPPAPPEAVSVYPQNPPPGHPDSIQGLTWTSGEERNDLPLIQTDLSNPLIQTDPSNPEVTGTPWTSGEDRIDLPLIQTDPSNPLIQTGPSNPFNVPADQLARFNNIQAIYDQFLGRNIGQAGIDHFLNSNKTIDEINAEVRGSPERADVLANNFNANFLATPEGQAIIAAGAGDPNGILIPDVFDVLNPSQLSSSLTGLSQDEVNDIFLQAINSRDESGIQVTNTDITPTNTDTTTSGIDTDAAIAAAFAAVGLNPDGTPLNNTIGGTTTVNTGNGFVDADDLPFGVSYLRNLAVVGDDDEITNRLIPSSGFNAFTSGRRNALLGFGGGFFTV